MNVSARHGDESKGAKKGKSGQRRKKKKRQVPLARLSKDWVQR